MQEDGSDNEADEWGDGGGDMERPLPDVTHLVWSQDDRQPRIHQFTGDSGLKTDAVNAESSPLDFYQLFMSDIVFGLIATETNNYAQQAGNDRFIPTTTAEIKVYWGLSMLMGIVKKPNIESYWSIKDHLSTPIFAKTMTRERYWTITKYLHFANNEQASLHDKLAKIRPFYDLVTKSFAEVRAPGEKVSIDEALIKFFGRLRFKTYIANKPAEYGLKAFKLSDDTGYTYKFDLYNGTPAPDGCLYKGVVKVVMDLLNGYLGQGRKVWMDNRYNSPELFKLLLDYQTHAAGTLRLNRRGVPRELKDKKKMKKGEIIFRRCEDLLVMVWKDKTDVSLISTMHRADMVTTGKVDRTTNGPVQKPQLVIDYNKHIAGVVCSDQLTNTYRDTRKSLKWYKKLVFHLSDLSVTNAFVLYKATTNSTMSYMSFIEAIVMDLLRIHCSARPIPKRPLRTSLDASNRLQYKNSKHWPSHIIAAEGAKRRNPTRACVVCRANGKRSETRYQCTECSVVLHPECFVDYHTREHISR